MDEKLEGKTKSEIEEAVYIKGLHCELREKFSKGLFKKFTLNCWLY